MEPEGLARLWHLTQPALPSKSGYFAIDTSIEHGRYWAWALDDPCSYCAWYMEQVRRYEEWEKKMGYERVVPEGPNS